MSDRLPTILEHWGLATARVEPISIGLINRSFLIDAPGGPSYVLQRVNPIFTPAVHDDIEALTLHLERSGLATPRLIRSRTGGLYVEDGGEVWRLLSYIDGRTKERLASPEEAREAGVLLARFHRAVADLAHDFKNRRLGVHDTARHVSALKTALDAHRGVHPRYEVLRPLGEEVLDLAARLPKLPQVADRVVHGDPKISNLLFDPKTGRGLALVDLDTLARMPLPLELGDAFRSWCNPSGEDRTSTDFSLPLFSGAVGGYASAARAFITEDEQRSIEPATMTIIVELAARFAADALNESYFGWDPTRFATRGEHNELRARGQLSLARSLAGKRDEARAIVEHAFK